MISWFNNLDDTSKIELFSTIASLFTSIVAIVISILTLVQNNKIIFESSKPSINIFSKVVSFTSPYSFIILKNFGASGATIENIEYDDVLNTYFEKKPFEHMKNVFIAPNQSYIYPLEPHKEPDTIINFKITYKYLNKTYTENCAVNFEQFKDVCYVKVHSSKDMKELSDILQEMTFQNL